MPQRYKLRLGDGTVVSVDSDGLKTWADDRRAMAQAVGTAHWRPLREVVAEEDAAARLARALVPPTPRGAPDTPSSSAAAEPPEFDLGAEPEPGAPRPQLQSLADDPAPFAARAAEPAPVVAADDLPIIPMKPLEDERRPQTTWQGEPQEFRSAWDELGDDTEEEDERDRDGRRGSLDGPLLSVLQALGGFLSRGLDRLAPVADRLLEQRRDWSEARQQKAALARSAPEPSGSPVIQTLADDPEPDSSTPLARVSGWLGGLSARVRGAAPEPEPSAPRTAPVPPRALPAEKPLRPPPPVSELPVLKLRDNREPREREDVFEGDRSGSGLSIDLGPLWHWTRRLVTWGVVIAAAAYAWIERDVWFPRAANVGQTTFTEIDRLVLSRERADERARALASAAERLPGLDPRTIELVFDRGASGLPEAPDVFQISREATERGMGTLPPAEADELRALQAELLAVLGPSERRMVNEYDQTRARRELFPFENPQVMELVARGTLALPPERRERLRQLTHQAVAAGLELPSGAAAASSTP